MQIVSIGIAVDDSYGCVPIPAPIDDDAMVSQWFRSETQHPDLDLIDQSRPFVEHWRALFEKRSHPFFLCLRAKQRVVHLTFELHASV